MATTAPVSELRLVLLGNSWSERSSVGNFILGKAEFNTEEEPDKCLRARAKIKEKDVFIINTPDLLNPNISEDKLTDLVTDCVRLSDPGPHVFLLVLQPEDFNFISKVRLCRVLKRFSDKSFDHSLILISPPRKHASGVLSEMIKESRDRYLEKTNLDHSELLTHLVQIVKENNGEHVNCDVFIDPTSETQITQQEKTSPGILHPVTSTGLQVGHRRVTPPREEIRIWLLGKNDDVKTKLGQVITLKEKYRAHRLPHTGKQKVETGEWRKKTLKVIKLTDVFSLSVEKLRREMRNAVSLCPPGPNVLLLLVKPSEFTEENRQTLKFILSLFGPDAFKHSVVISTHEDGQTEDSFRQLLRDCGERHYSMSENNHESLMTQIKSLFDENRGAFLNLTEELMTLKPEKMKPALNLVLCGRRGAGKSSAAEAILGQTGLHSASRSSECVQHQGEVCGRWVSLVDLPALSGKPLETVMKESLRSVSLCDPEGVHAFILVLPVGPLTDEDKGELETIHNTFSSQVNDFTMILFTTESDPTKPAVSHFVGKDQDIQRLIQSCGGRHFILNLRDQQQIPELLDVMERMQKDKVKPRSFATEMYAYAQMEKINKLHAKLKDWVTWDDVKQSSECLKIVLIGKTGSGKSSSGNTILGRKAFEARLCPTSVTRESQKAHGEVNGRLVAVVDTPGLFDTTLSHKQVYEEMIKCVSFLAPGPHVFLLVLKIDRFTPEEKETLKLIREGFGKDAENFTIILFTGGDSLKKEKLSIEEYMKTGHDESFKKLISDCGGRYHVFSNYDDGNREQVSELITKIDTLVKTNGGSCFTNEMLQEAEAAIKKEMEKLMKEKEEEMKREREELEKKHKEKMKEMEEKMKKQEEDIKQEREKRERELKEMGENIKKEQEDRMKEQEMREEEDRKKKEQEQLQRQEWEHKLKALERKRKFELEEKESINRQLEKSSEKVREEKESLEKKQKEWWDKRIQEDEQRRLKEQTSIRKLQEEFEHERENYEKKRKEQDLKKHEEDEKLKLQQREEIEKERKQKEKQLKEMEENIKKEQEDRRKEQKMREEEDRKRKRQEELQRQEWEQKLKALERKRKFELEEKETTNRQLEENTKKMREEKESLERAQKEWWEKRNQEEEQRRHGERTKLRKLQEEFEQERRKYENERKEEDQKRQEEVEREKKEISENHEKEKENLKISYEEEARKKAEEFNEFKEKYENDYAAQRDKYEKKRLDQICEILKCVTKKKQNVQKISNLLKKQEVEMEQQKNEKDKKNLLDKHENEMRDLLKELSKDNSMCTLL